MAFKTLCYAVFLTGHLALKQYKQQNQMLTTVMQKLILQLSWSQFRVQSSD